jgi:uncharacterized protein (DUF1330 family)
MSAYLIAQVDVHDPDTYKKYTAGVPATLEKYGGTFRVRGGEVTPNEGGWDQKRHEEVQDPDMAALHRWYDSPEYQKIIGIRHEASEGKMIFVEGA